MKEMRWNERDALVNAKTPWMVIQTELFALVQCSFAPRYAEDRGFTPLSAVASGRSSAVYQEQLSDPHHILLHPQGASIVTFHSTSHPRPRPLLQR